MDYRTFIPTKPTRRHIVNGLGLLILIAIVAPFVVYAVPQLIGATESYVVQSGSMEPTIQTGSVIFVYETEPSAIEEGDIIAYNLREPDQRVTTHRVVDVTRDGELLFRTKGDANEDPDQYTVSPDAVIGTVPIVAESVTIPFVGYFEELPLQIPYLGRVLIVAGSKWGIFFLVMVPAALLIISETYTLIKAYRTGSPTDADDETTRSRGDD